MGKLAQRVTLVLGIGALLGMAAVPAAGESLFGVGVHSWRTVSDLKSRGFGDIKRSGLSYLLSYQMRLIPLLKLEIDAEYFNKGFGGSTRSAISPQVYVLAGGFVYGGVGIGTIYSSGFAHNFSSPYYTARAGLDVHVIPRFHLDVNANYHFHAFHELSGVSTGTVTLGAIARFAL